MAKYHIGKRGLPVICTAKEGNCPLQKGDNIVPHFSSKEKALDYLDYSNSLIYDNSIAQHINTNNLSSLEIKGYIDLNKKQIELLEKENKDIRKIVTNISNKSVEKQVENRTEFEQEIIDTTSDMLKKGFIKKRSKNINDHTEDFVIDKINNVPSAYFENVKGPIKILSEHSLVYKYGPNKGRIIQDPSKLTEKNLNWINQYKNDPELLKSDLEQIQSNMKNFNKLFYLKSNNQLGLKSDYIVSQEKIKGQDKVKNSLTLSNQEKENNSNLNQLYKLQKQLVEDYDIHKKLEAYNKDSNIITSFNSKSIPVDNDSESFEIKEKLTVDKKGQINNLYIYNRDKNNSPLVRVTALNDNTTNNIETDGGTFNITTHYVRRKLGRWAMANDGTDNFDFIVTSSPKNSSDYNGSKTIHHSYFDTTDF